MEWLRALIEKHTKDGVINNDALLKEVNTEFPKYAVPKSEFNTLNDTKKTLETQIAERDTQLTELNKKVKGNEDLEKTITDLQAANATTKAEYETKLKDIQINTAIQSKLTDTKYADLLTSKFDKTKISLSDDGTVLGIDEQLTTIKETYKDLFTPVVTGRDPNNSGGNPKVISKEQFTKMSYKERVDLYNTNVELYNQLSE